MTAFYADAELTTVAHFVTHDPSNPL